MLREVVGGMSFGSSRLVTGIMFTSSVVLAVDESIKDNVSVLVHTSPKVPMLAAVSYSFSEICRMSSLSAGPYHCSMR